MPKVYDKVTNDITPCKGTASSLFTPKPVAVKGFVKLSQLSLNLGESEVLQSEVQTLQRAKNSNAKGEVSKHSTFCYAAKLIRRYLLKLPKPFSVANSIKAMGLGFCVFMLQRLGITDFSFTTPKKRHNSNLSFCLLFFTENYLWAKQA